jgi:hypothetical protein
VGGAPNRVDISATLDAIAQNTATRTLTTTPGSPHVDH